MRIRRSLLALQALPMIEPSADFREKLAARLTQERQITRLTLSAPTRERRSTMRWVAGAVAAASIVALLVGVARPRDLTPARLAPVLARAPEPVATPTRSTAPATVATTRSSARFEALPGQLPLRAPSEIRPSALRVQTVNYIGQ